MSDFDYPTGQKMKVIEANAKSIPVGTIVTYEGLATHFCGKGLCALISGWGGEGNVFLATHYLEPYYE